MTSIRVAAAFVAIFPWRVAADDVPPAESPTPARAAVIVWLDRAVDEAKAVEDPLLRSQALSKSAVLMARMGDVSGYRSTIDLAEKSFERAGGKPEESPVKHAIALATAPLLRTLARTGDMAAAKALADERSKEHAFLRAGHYASIAAGRVEAGDVEGALRLADTFDEYGRRTVLKFIATALVAGHDFARAEQVSTLMGPTDLERRDALRAVAAARARAGEYERTLAMAELFPYDHDKQAVYQYVVEAQAEAGDFAAARETAARVPLGEDLAWPNPPPVYGRTSAFTAIARAQLKHKDIAGAKETATMFDGELKPHVLREIAMAEIEAGQLDAARQTAEAIPPGGTFTPREEAFAALAYATARRGDMAGAVAVARTLREPLDTMVRLAALAIKVGKPDDARAIVHELKGGHANGQFWLDGDSRRIHIARLEKALGDPAPYAEILADFQRREAEAAEAGDAETRRMLAGQLFAIHVGDGRIEDAKRFAPHVPENVKGMLVAVLAQGAADAGDVDLATSLAELMPTPEDRAAMRQAILHPRGRPPATDTEAAEQIARMPAAYDRSLAYLARAEAAWQASLRPATKPPAGAAPPTR